MDCADQRHLADRAYMAYRVRAQQVLKQEVAPQNLPDAERLRVSCTEALRQLRAVKAECLEQRHELRKSIVASDENHFEITTKLHEWNDLHEHVEQLIGAVTSSKAEASAAIVSFREAGVVEGESIPLARSNDRLEGILAGLAELHQAGTLSDKEFELAKARVMQRPIPVEK